MLYETLLKKLKKRRLSSGKGDNGVTALEVIFLLLDLIHWPSLCHLLLCRWFSKITTSLWLDIFAGCFGKTWSYSCDISSSGCQGT